VFRGLLVESLLLSATGAAIGVGIGRIALRAFSAYMPAGTLPAEAIAALDGRALAFTALLAVVTGLLAGTVPAWHGARDNVSGALRSTGRSVSGSRASARLHGGLLVTEIALAMILVTGAALLVASFVRLTRVSPGFDATDVLTLRLSLPETRYRSAQAVADFYGRVTATLQALPRVADAAAITSLPLGGWLYGATFSVEGEPVDPARPPAAHVQHATPGYFGTLGIPLAAGRAFTTRDDARAPLVAVINETFARRFIPAGDAVGRVVRMDEFNLQGEDDARWRIVGVIRDVKTYGLDDAELATPEIYIPVAQSPTPSLFVTVRSDGSPATALVPDVRAAIRTLDPELPIADLQTMTDRVGGSVTSERFRTALVGGFAALAALLACLGVYAVRSQAVVARRREIGIRVALGAKPGDVLAMVLGQSARLVVAGLGLGLAGALAMTRVLDRWLFATDARDPWMLAGAMAALGLAAIAASWVPARRAAAVDPLTVLRDA
ncbi:MAG: FtsX-like permease family protein, partial [Vicinamibacterales bacterium]